ncbi:MAG: hypothetical protein LRY73_02030 [Bacillus sp. (in: Bacteria)]|nr:hypothetical protein [Bacillus sp. (in: firmicutes)]
MISKQINKNLGIFFLIGILVTVLLVFASSVGADENREITLREQSQVDVNHTETIDKIWSYLDTHVRPDIFASLHIDRETDPAGIIVLSFTEDIKPETQEELEEIAGDNSPISFRIVPYTEKQLLEKQREIDADVFGDNSFTEQGITVHHTGPDIINSKVQIGISPFNKENSNFVHDYFDSDMISVVEGFEAQLLIGSVEGELGEEESDLMEATIDAPLLLEEGEPEGFFRRIWNWLIQLFN